MQDLNGRSTKVLSQKRFVGFRSARINPSSYTNGGDISISAKFIDKFELGKLRAKYFSGINTAQAELSGGYDFTKGLFTGVSVNAPYINLGVDYLIKAKESRFEPYAMVNSLGKYHKPTSTETATCPDGYPFYNSYWEQYAARYPDQSYAGPCFSEYPNRASTPNLTLKLRYCFFSLLIHYEPINSLYFIRTAYFFFLFCGLGNAIQNLF
jgi:hypothetical protein